MGYNESQDSAGKRAALVYLNNYMDGGRQAGMRLRKTIQDSIIRPLKVFTKDMRFEMREKGLPAYFAAIDGAEQEFCLHTHAFRRMREEADLSSTTTRVMLEGPEWDRKNLEMLLNSKFSNKGFIQRGGGMPRFINLVVGNQVRGFVGRGFKRHLRSGPLLDAFIKSCAQFGAMPVSAIASDLRVTLRCMLPYAFSPRSEEYLALGISFSNSDFGAGAFRLELTVMSLRNGHVMPMKTLNGSGHGEGHNGGKGDDDAMDSTELSEETVLKLIHAKQGEVEDLVRSALHQASANAFFDEVAEAMEKKISWHQFERYLRGKLTQEEMEVVQSLLKKGSKSSELPEVTYDSDDQAIMDLWFASNVLGKIAEGAEGERKEELQSAAGKLLIS